MTAQEVARYNRDSTWIGAKGSLDHTSDTTTHFPSNQQPPPAAHHRQPNSSGTETSPTHSQRMSSTGTLSSEDQEALDLFDEKYGRCTHPAMQQVKHKPHSHSYWAERDPEKTIVMPQRISHSTLQTHDAMSVTDSNDSISDATQLQSQKALKILLYLSGPCVALSLFNLLWTLIALLITVLFQPLHLVSRRPAFKQQLCYFLAPPLNWQLRRIYTRLGRDTYADGNHSGLWLVTVHILSPVISLGLAIAAWVVALYWFLARIVGDPSGTDRRDDGVEAVLGLRRWWEGWLIKGIENL